MLSKFRQELKDFYRLSREQHFYGDDLFCPFCLKKSKVEQTKKQAKYPLFCPFCNSAPDDRSLLVMLKSMTDLASEKCSTLLIGEDNQLNSFLAKQPAVEWYKFIPTADYRLPERIQNSKFDLIICNYVAEKQPDDLFFFKRMSQLLNPGGRIIIQANVDYDRETTLQTVVSSSDDRIRIYGYANNYRRYGRDYLSRISGNNFIAQIWTAGDGFKQKFAGCGLTDDLHLYYLAEKEIRLSDKSSVYSPYLNLQAAKCIHDRRFSLIYHILNTPVDLYKSFSHLMSRLHGNPQIQTTWLYFFYIIIVGSLIGFTGMVFVFSVKHYLLGLLGSVYGGMLNIVLGITATIISISGSALILTYSQIIDGLSPVKQIIAFWYGMFMVVFFFIALLLV